MANTLVSELMKSTYFCKGSYLLYGQFSCYGYALNYCISEGLPIASIKTVYSLDGKIDFYTTDRHTRIKPGIFTFEV